MKTAHHSIEPLEARVAPASLTFADVDGDKIVVTTSGTGALVLGGNVFVVGNGVGIDLTVGAAGFEGANVSVVATRNVATGGDGFVNVRYINAFGVDLGTVLIDGGLDEITCGDATTDLGFGLKSLSVRSLGNAGVSGVESHIVGRLGTLKIKGDLNNAWLHVTGNGVGDEAHGTIGPVTIGGSIIGGLNSHSGAIESSGAIGAVKITHDLRGGTGSDSGEIVAHGMGAVTIGGSILGTKTDPGGGHLRTGVLESLGAMGAVKIGGDVDGGVLNVSGYIHSTGRLAALTVTGSLLGGPRSESGLVSAGGGIAGLLKIGHDVKGGGDSLSGAIYDGNMGAARGKVGAIFIGGSLSGDASNSSGGIFLADQLTPASLMIKGNMDSGAISGGDIGKISIVGSMSSGTLLFSGAVGSISIGGDFGSLAQGARILVQGHDVTPGHPSITIKTITIGGNVLNSSINAGQGAVALNPDAQIGSVKVKGNWSASSLTAGVTSGTDIYFGDANDAAIPQAGEPDAFFSRIASIVIGGNVLAAPGAAHFGFVAQQIGSFKSLGFTAPLTAGTDFDIAIPSTSNIRIVEVL